MSVSKQKGTAAETAVVRHLEENDLPAQRLVMHGPNDLGDIQTVVPLVIEVKNCKTMKLAEWVDEANREKANAGVKIGVVWHKRPRKGKPGQWYVTMNGDDFTRILKAIDKSRL
jgi:hypothetical protein